MKRLLLICIILLALAACQTPQPTSAPPADTASPPTHTPVIVSTPTPSATAAPTEAEPSPTATATETTTAAPTETPATPSPTATPAAGTSDVYVNSEDGLNFRAEASATATLLRLLPFATHLTAIGQPTAPDARGIAWLNVRTDDGQVGWVAAQYLSTTNPAAATPEPSPVAAEPGLPVVQPGSYVYVASTGGLNLRERASASSHLVMTLANGQRLQTNGLIQGPDAFGITWLNVKTDGDVEGWVSVEFVTEQVPSVAPATPPPNVPDAVAEILRRTNELRQQNGLPAYIYNADLARLALEHSQFMAQNGITHIGYGGLSAKQRIANAGYGPGTENIYGGEASIDDAWTYWATDPPHVDNLLNRFHTLVGIAVYEVGRRTYYTMDFGRPAQ